MIGLANSERLVTSDERVQNRTVDIEVKPDVLVVPAHEHVVLVKAEVDIPVTITVERPANHTALRRLTESEVTVNIAQEHISDGVKLVVEIVLSTRQERTVQVRIIVPVVARSIEQASIATLTLIPVFNPPTIRELAMLLPSPI